MSFSTSKIPPNVDLAQTQSPQLLAGTSTILALSFIAVLLRLISRRVQKVKLSASDYTIIIGMVGAWSIALLVIVEATRGMGKHIEVVPIAQVVQALQTLFAGEILYSISFPIIKISILLLYRQIFTSRHIRVGTIIIGIITVLWGIAVILVTIFSCIPVYAFWDVLYTGPKKCISSKWFFIGVSIPNIMADVAILALPIKDVWQLNMGLRDKLSVLTMFLLGSFVVIASGLRIYFMWQMNIEDLTYTYSGVDLWSAIEINVAVVSACLPTLRPIMSLTVSLLKGDSTTRSASVGTAQSTLYWRTTFDRDEKARRLSLPAHGLDDLTLVSQSA